MLSESQCLTIENALTDEIEPRKLTAYLCLHMGLTLGEASAVRFEDIDFNSKTLTIRNTLSRTDEPSVKGRTYALYPSEAARTIPIPPQVLKLFSENANLYLDGKCFLINAKHETPKAHMLQNLLVSINDKYHLTKQISVGMLREVFVRRALECGIDLYTVSVLLGVKQLAMIQKKYGKYLAPQTGKIDLLERYTPEYIPRVLPANGGKRMNLLILGAGSQGSVVKEIAEAIGIFETISYLDDNSDNKLAIDTCENFERYTERYPIAIPSFGNCELRKKWAERLSKAGFILPKLIHPSAMVSPNAVIEAPVIIEMKAVVGTGVIVKPNCIIGASVLLNPAVQIGENSHIGGGVTVMKGAVVEPFSKLHAGTVFGKDKDI